MQTTVEIDVLLELRDYLKANYWFIFRRFRLVLLVFGFGAVYPLVLLILGELDTQNSGFWAYFLPPAMLAILFAATYFNTKKHMASNKSLSERVHYVFSESGIETTAPSFSGQIAWQNVYKAYETRSNFLIFISKNMMYIIPKRCFVSVEQIASFKTLVLSQLDQKAKWE